MLIIFTLFQAYATFPNGGQWPEGHFIKKIVGPTGDIIVDFKPKETEVTTAEVAKEMTKMLEKVVEKGTGQAAKIKNVSLAGKTGSTQLPYSDLKGTKDQWFVGYTEDLLGAVWLGYDQTDRDHYLSGRTSDTVLPILKSFFTAALGDEKLNEVKDKSKWKDLQKKCWDFIERTQGNLDEIDFDDKLDQLKDQFNNFTNKIRNKINK